MCKYNIVFFCTPKWNLWSQASVYVVGWPLGCLCYEYELACGYINVIQSSSACPSGTCIVSLLFTSAHNARTPVVRLLFMLGVGLWVYLCAHFRNPYSHATVVSWPVGMLLHTSQGPAVVRLLFMLGVGLWV